MFLQPLNNPYILENEHPRSKKGVFFDILLEIIVLLVLVLV